MKSRSQSRRHRGARKGRNGRQADGLEGKEPQAAVKGGPTPELYSYLSKREEVVVSSEPGSSASDDSEEDDVVLEQRFDWRLSLEDALEEEDYPCPTDGSRGRGASKWEKRTSHNRAKATGKGATSQTILLPLEESLCSNNDDSAAAKDYLENILAGSDGESFIPLSSDLGGKAPLSFGDDDDCDETFARLVCDYRRLMIPDDAQPGVEWALDERADQILADRRASNPKYASMSRAKFEQYVMERETGNGSEAFRETYGAKERGRHSPPSLVLRHRNGQQGQKDATESVNFKQVNRDVRAFVKSKEEEMALAPCSSVARQWLHKLAIIYGLSSKSRGAGSERHCVLTKTSKAAMPRQLSSLDKFLANAQRAVSFAPRNGDTPSGRRGGEGKKGKGADQKSSARPATGTVIGGEAEPISDDNIGSMMLKKLGWTPGQGLGSASHGIVDPVSAIFKSNRVGLGN